MKLIKIILVFLLSFNLYGQRFDWKGSLGGADADSAVNIQLDLSGNVYTSGIFYGEIDLNQDTIKSNNFKSNGLSDFFIQKTNPFGEFLWGKKFGNDSIDRITNVKYFDNKLFIIGQFSKILKLDDIELKSNGKLDGFVAALDTSGNVIWANSYGGLSNDIFSTLIVNETGVYVSGIFTGNIMNQSANGSLLIAKIKLDGSQLVWSKLLGESFKIKSNGSAFDSKGNIFLAGGFKGQKIDFNPSLTKDSLLSSEMKIINDPNSLTQDAFILKLNSEGEFIYVKKIGGASGDDIILDISSSKGNFGITGKVTGSVIFSGGSNTKTIFGKGEDIFVAIYNDLGDLNWVKNVGGIKTDIGKSIYLDSNLNVYVTGTFFDTDGKGVDFDPSPSVNKLNSSVSQNAFIWKLTAAGDYSYAGSFGGSGVDNGNFIYANDEEEIFATGVFEEESKFYDQKLKSKGKSDIFLIKSVSEREVGYIIDYELEGMNPDSLPFRLEVGKKDIGNLPWYNKQYILTNVKDSDGDTNTVIINNLQGPVDITAVPYFKYAAKACSDYEVSSKKSDWYLPSLEELQLMFKKKKSIGGMKNYPYWCSSETDLNNANSIDFTDGKTNSTSDKADRKYVRPVRKKMKNDGLNVYNLTDVNVYPNPTIGKCLITIDQKYIQNGVNVEILNTSGQLIDFQNQKYNTVNIDLSKFDNGIYFIKLYNDSFNSISKVVKE